MSIPELYPKLAHSNLQLSKNQAIHCRRYLSSTSIGEFTRYRQKKLNSPPYHLKYLNKLGFDKGDSVMEGEKGIFFKGLLRVSKTFQSETNLFHFLQEVRLIKFCTRIHECDGTSMLKLRNMKRFRIIQFSGIQNDEARRFRFMLKKQMLMVSPKVQILSLYDDSYDSMCLDEFLFNCGIGFGTEKEENLNHLKIFLQQFPSLKHLKIDIQNQKMNSFDLNDILVGHYNIQSLNLVIECRDWNAELSIKTTLEQLKNLTNFEFQLKYSDDTHYFGELPKSLKEVFEGITGLEKLKKLSLAYGMQEFLFGNFGEEENSDIEALSNLEQFFVVLTRSIEKLKNLQSFKLNIEGLTGAKEEVEVFLEQLSQIKSLNSLKLLFPSNNFTSEIIDIFPKKLQQLNILNEFQIYLGNKEKPGKNIIQQLCRSISACTLLKRLSICLSNSTLEDQTQPVSSIFGEIARLTLLEILEIKMEPIVSLTNTTVKILENSIIQLKLLRHLTLRMVPDKSISNAEVESIFLTVRCLISLEELYLSFTCQEDKFALGNKSEGIDRDLLTKMFNSLKDLPFLNKIHFEQGGVGADASLKEAPINLPKRRLF